MRKKYGFATKLVHPTSNQSIIKAISTPIYQSSTFAFNSAEEGAKIFAGEQEGYFYTRISNPTTRVLEKSLAEIENGEDSRVCASGMSAIFNTVTSVASKGDNVITTDCLYGGTHKLFFDILPKFGLEITPVDTSNLTEVKSKIKNNTKLIYIETPSNPTLKLTDIKKITDIAKKQNLLTAVDNTFMSPYFQQPLNLGANIVIHSLTKYINGHSDIVGGAIISSKNMLKKIDPILTETGGTLGPFQAWLTIRGIKTLPLRMDKHNKNALEIAYFLEKHPKIEKVHYPGLKSHPQHELALSQMSGFGGMISFELAGGVEEGRKLMNSVKLCTLAVSLGSVETLIEHPASMTHSNVPVEERKKIGITNNLVRLSVGIEDVKDIIEDLKQALKQISI